MAGCKIPEKDQEKSCFVHAEGVIGCTQHDIRGKKEQSRQNSPLPATAFIHHTKQKKSRSDTGDQMNRFQKLQMKSKPTDENCKEHDLRRQVLEKKVPVGENTQIEEMSSVKIEILIRDSRRDVDELDD